jgi:hypothetical protein
MKTVLLLISFVLGSIHPVEAQAINRYADASTTGGCSNGSTNYNPTTRACGSGSDVVYTGAQAIQLASNASSASDVILVRSSATLYTGTGQLGSVLPRSGTSTGSRFTIRGYQNELPQIKAFDAESSSFVHIYQVKIDSNNAASVSGIFGDMVGWRVDEYGFTTEVSNHGAQGFSGCTDGAACPGSLELINLNVHHNGFNSPDHCQLPGARRSATAPMLPLTVC